MLHAVNHALKARSKVIKNNAKMKANPDLEVLDQGFTRPKVLIVLPYKSCVAKVVELIIKLTIDLTTAKPGKSVRKYDKYVSSIFMVIFFFFFLPSLFFLFPAV